MSLINIPDNPVTIQRSDVERVLSNLDIVSSRASFDQIQEVTFKSDLVEVTYVRYRQSEYPVLITRQIRVVDASGADV